MGAISAEEFTQNFERYQREAQHEAVAVSNGGEIAGYFVRREDYEDLMRFKSRRRSFATVDLDPEKVRAIAETRMDARHAHLDALLEPDSGDQ